MSEPRTAAIVGLGLIGGSLARDLAARGTRVLGYDRDGDALAQAVADGVVSRPLDRAFAGLEAADWVVLATPVNAAPGLLERMRPLVGRARLVTDVGSTKRGIVAAAARLGLSRRFVGSHPLAGSVRSGWGAARAGLFAGARVYLCPTSGSDAVALGEADMLWRSVGATTEKLEAGEHDRRLAWTSHLPQVASTAQALVLAAAGVTPDLLGPGGRDATRLAASAATMWTGITTENADLLAPAIAALEVRLAAARAAIERRDTAALDAFFSGGAAWAAQRG